MIYLFRVRVSFAVSYAVADIWMMIYVIFARVPCSCSVMGGYCLSVDISYNCFIVLFCLCVYSGHYKDSTLLLCTHIVGRFFTREYLYKV